VAALRKLLREPMAALQRAGGQLDYLAAQFR